MKIAVLNLTGGGVSGGYKKYLSAMLSRLAQAPEISEILCASPASFGAEKWLAGTAKVKFAACEPFRFMRHSPDPALKLALDEFKPDVIFVPIERYIAYRGVPVVIMVQNMAPLSGVKTGTGLKERLVALVRRYETRIALARADAVIVPTEYVKNFLAGTAGFPAEKITAVHYGHSLAPAAARPPAAFPFHGKRFVLTAGSLESYRGIEDLLLAFPDLKQRHPGLKLAVAGGSRPATEPYFSFLKSLAAARGLAGDIAWLGDLPEEELSWCYSNCAAFALTSRMESFCFVALEALTHGCGIVSTDSACLPEIFGSEAAYYKAGDAPALGLALSAVLDRPSDERRRISEAAARRGAGFLWDDAAAKTIKILKEVSPRYSRKTK